jgi:ParB/RepB/Spo0J family partition protein
LAIEILLDEILETDFSFGLPHARKKIDSLARSLSLSGQLSPIKVRKSKEIPGKYEVVYGHRRFYAAKENCWIRIRAEIIEATDEEVLRYTLAENFEREELADYEKALIFKRLNSECGKTYLEIGRMVGLSKQQVGGYLSMLQLFDNQDLEKRPELISALNSLTEHHCRILSRIQDPETRMALAIRAERDQLSVKDLSNLVGRLRSWFLTEESRDREGSAPSKKKSSDDVSVIRELIEREFLTPAECSFETFRRSHLFEEGFSLFRYSPPFDSFEGDVAAAKELDWFRNHSSRISWKLSNIRIKIIEKTAISTFKATIWGVIPGPMVVRATMVFVRKSGHWKIIHEHWSRAENEALVRSQSVNSAAPLSVSESIDQKS